MNIKIEANPNWDNHLAKWLWLKQIKESNNCPGKGLNPQSPNSQSVAVIVGPQRPPIDNEWLIIQKRALQSAPT